MALTRDEVLAKKPGPELDALAATEVMGWGRLSYGDEEEFSRDIADAFYTLEERIDELGLRREYGIKLWELVRQANENPTLASVFDIAHASPELRVKAALLSCLASPP